MNVTNELKKVRASWQKRIYNGFEKGGRADGDADYSFGHVWIPIT